MKLICCFQVSSFEACLLVLKLIHVKLVCWFVLRLVRVKLTDLQVCFQGGPCEAYRSVFKVVHVKLIDLLVFF